MSRSALTPLALVALSLACSSTTSPQVTGGDFLSTDAKSYVVSQRSTDPRFPTYSFTVVATFTNRTTSPVYLARCYPNSRGPMFGVELADERNANAAGYDPNWACVGHDKQFVVAPGASRADTLQISGPTGFTGGGGTGRGALFGRMRLRYRVQSCVGDAVCRLAPDVGLSNVFEVRLSP